MARSSPRLAWLCSCTLAACTSDFGQFDFSGLSATVEGGSGAVPGDKDGGEDASTNGSDSGGGGVSGRGGVGSGGAADGSVGGGSPLDSGRGVPDALGDSGAPDVGRSTDAGPPDATTALPDAQAPDVRGIDGGGDASPPSCDALYGSVAGYVLCMSTPTTCSFYAATSGSNCEAVCVANAGTCIDAADNRGGQPCVVMNAADTCQTTRNDTICTCSRP